MSAKFIDQIEMSKPCVSRASSPADATSPRIVSSSGRPAATIEPKASTMIVIVTGQEKSSDFIIAFRFAVLKSLHIPGLPASETLTEDVPAAFRPDLRSSAAATIAVGLPFAPAVTIAVWPSAEILVPGRGVCTEATRLSAERTCSTRASVCRNAGEEVVAVGGWTAAVRGWLGRAAKFRWVSVRAVHGSETVARPPGP